MPDTYGNPERAALIVLALENREIPNPELTKDYGIELSAAGRTRLNKDGMIKTWKEGRRLVHRITEAGVDWCEEELTRVEAPARSNALSRAVFEALRLVLRYGDVSLVDVLRSAGLESLIRESYRELRSKPNGWVRLADLRANLDGMGGADVERVLLALTRTGSVHLTPDSDRSAVTDADRAAAIRIGSEDKHLVAIEES
jgi:hypothetical protein